MPTFYFSVQGDNNFTSPTNVMVRRRISDYRFLALLIITI